MLLCAAALALAGAPATAEEGMWLPGQIGDIGADM